MRIALVPQAARTFVAGSVLALLAAGSTASRVDPESAAGGSRHTLSVASGFCAAPPAPGKQGFRLVSHYAPRRDHRPLRPLGQPLARALPDTIDALAIRVDFDDHPMDSTRTYFNRVFFFVQQYWQQATYGQLVIRTTVSDSVYRMPQTMEYYGDDERIEERQTLLIRDAVRAADRDYNLAAFDAHVCVHAGNGQEGDVLGDSPEQIWSSFAPLELLQANLPDSTRDRGILTNDLTPGGQPYFVQFALVLPEVESQDYDDRFNPPIPYIFGMTGVCSHEFGHVLGLPDLYDTTPEDFADSQGVGIFDIMSHGTWNNAGFVPARPCAWSLFELGCLNVDVITRPGRYDLPAVDGSAGPPRAAAIPIGGDEYFLLENRVQDPNRNGIFDFNDVDQDSLFSFYVDDYQGAEFDFFLPGDGTGSGLLIWHVDSSAIDANLSSNTVEGDAAHKGIDLEEADGVQDLDGFPVSILSFGSPEDAYRAGNRVRFGPETIPNSNSSYDVPTFVAVDSVSTADSVMTFVVTFDRRKAGAWPVTLTGPVGGNHPAVAEITSLSPGLETVVVDTTGGVWVISGDGNPPPGFAAPLGRVGADANTAPAIGDIDGDGSPEIVVAGADGRIYAWNGDGSEVRDGDNNPATIGVWAQVGRSLRDEVPVLANLGGSGLAVVIGSPADSKGVGEVIWCQQQGPVVDVSRVDVPGDVTAPPLVFTGAAPAILAPVSSQGRTRFYAVRPLARTARELDPGRPERQGVVRALVAGDLDGDGALEIVASDDRGRIEALATDVPRTGGAFALDRLRPLTGWPFELNRRTAHDLALADIDQDGRVEVLVSSVDGRLYAVNFNGTPQLFFPEVVGESDRPLPALVPSPLAVDLGAGPLPEMIFAPGDGRAFAVDGEGRLLPGWPLPGPAAKGVVPVIADIDADGRLDMVAPSDFGSGTVLVAYELGAAEGPGSVWPAYRGGPEHRGILDAAPLTAAPQTFLREVFVYPNPVVGDDAIIHFSLGADAEIKLEIMDVAGRVVARPQAPDAAAGRTDHEVRWNVSNAASGVYLLRLEARSGGQDAVEMRTFAVTR